jgi:hypothetical protein
MRHCSTFIDAGMFRLEATSLATRWHVRLMEEDHDLV